MSTNKVFLTGNVGKDPDVRTLEGGKKIAKFSLATTDKNKEKTTQWHSITVWDKLSEIVELYVKKGTQLTVIGAIQYRKYTDKDGVVKYITDITAHEIDLLGKKTDSETTNNEGEWKKGEKREIKSMSDVSELPGNVDDGNIPDDPDLPF